MDRRNRYLAKALGIIMAITGVISILFGILSVISDDKEYINANEIELVQFEQIEEGTPIAIIKTSVGEIRAVLYPEYAPSAVANFIELAENGFYDGTYIYSVSKDRQFIAGAENPDGTGSDADDNGFDSEIHDNLWPFKGAFISLNYKATVLDDGVTASGNRFLVCSSIEMNEEAKEALLGSSSQTLIADAFIEHGGIPNYSRKATVFAQTYAGLDVIDKITSVQVVEGHPKEDIIIESITISEYSSEEAENAES